MFSGHCLYNIINKAEPDGGRDYVFFPGCLGAAMNFHWGGMLLIGNLYGSLTGTRKEVTEEVISSSEEAVPLCVTVAGVHAMR